MSGERSTGLTIDYGCRTHLGGKKENQDFYRAVLDVANDVYCFVLADGLGGYKAGRNAARLAVDVVLDSFLTMDHQHPGPWLNEALQEAHQLIKLRNQGDAPPGKMKTTCVILALVRGKAYWASVGDSRVYVMRDQAVLHRSKDHSVVQVLLDMGEITPEEVPSHPDRNRVLRVLGMDEDMKPSIHADGIVLQRGDVFLLCTDGFWGCMDDKTIVEFVHGHRELKAQELIDSMFDRILSHVTAANGMDSQDNLSAQLVLVG